MRNFEKIIKKKGNIYKHNACFRGCWPALLLPLEQSSKGRAAGAGLPWKRRPRGLLGPVVFLRRLYQPRLRGRPGSGGPRAVSGPQGPGPFRTAAVSGRARRRLLAEGGCLCGACGAGAVGGRPVTRGFRCARLGSPVSGTGLLKMNSMRDYKADVKISGRLVEQSRPAVFLTVLVPHAAGSV